MDDSQFDIRGKDFMHVRRQDGSTVYVATDCLKIGYLGSCGYYRHRDWKKANAIIEAEGFRMISNRDWEAALKVLRKMHEEKPALRSPEQKFAYNYQHVRALMDFTGDCPVLWEDMKLVPRAGWFDAEGGKRTTVPWFPREGGFVQGWDEELCLPTKVGHAPNPDYQCCRLHLERENPKSVCYISRGAWRRGGYDTDDLMGGMFDINVIEFGEGHEHHNCYCRLSSETDPAVVLSQIEKQRMDRACEERLRADAAQARNKRIAALEEIKGAHPLLARRIDEIADAIRKQHDSEG